MPPRSTPEQLPSRRRTIYTCLQDGGCYLRVGVGVGVGVVGGSPSAAAATTAAAAAAAAAATAAAAAAAAAAIAATIAAAVHLVYSSLFLAHFAVSSCT